MKSKPQITKTISVRVMILLGLSILIVAMFHVYYLRVEFNRESEFLRVSYIESRKDELKKDVEAAVSLIYHEQKSLENTLMERLHDEVYRVHRASMSFYEKNYQRYSHEEIRNLIIEAVRPIRFNNGRGYFFMTGLNGVELLFSDRPEFEGRQLINMKSGDGRYIIRDMIRIAESKDGEGYYRYMWTKPFVKGNHYLKIAFIKKFEPLNCFIGTGEYLSDFELTRKRGVIEALSSIHGDMPGYYFVGQWDGVSLLGPPAVTGKNMWGVTDSDGKMVVQELVKAARSGGGFVEYHMPRQTGFPPVRKISYTLPVAEWQWYVGAGEFVDSIEDVIKNQRRTLLVKQFEVFSVYILLFCIITAMAWFYSRRLSSMVDSDIERLNEYFRENSKVGSEERNFMRPDFTFAEIDKIGEFAQNMMMEMSLTEEKLRVTERAKAIGELAGGIAHDFNNQLGGIIGFAELIKLRSSDNPELSRYVGNIIKSAQRSAELTSKLLAFARKGKYAVNAVDLNRIIYEVVEILSHTINRKIEVVMQLSDAPVIVMGDASQLQNALLNLGLNARDAMPDGGTLLYHSERVELSTEELNSLNYQALPGVYNKITVTDTGTGIPPEIINRIFEPLFTTKEIGKGTGMGLAAVDGTVRSHNGIIKVNSRVGEGTSFIIYLPASGSSSGIEHISGEIPGIDTLANLKIVMVDDEESLLHAGSRILGELGAEVVTFSSGIEALGYLKKGSMADCMILDMIMPQMSGSEVFSEARKLRPELPILVSSGYSSDSDVAELIKEHNVLFVQKPLRMKDLVAALHKLMLKQ